MTCGPRVSVIVPVWNDATRLAHCLHSLHQQSYPSENTELLVVDNGSTDASREVAASFPGVVLLEELRPGSYNARNCGLKKARGHYVAFIDSDCEASPRWLERAIVSVEKDTNIGIVAGRIKLKIDTATVLSSAILYEQMFAFNQEANANFGFCVTANWLSPKAILECFGGFDETLKSGADTKLAKQISAAGYKIFYDETALVHHPARSSLSSLCKKRRRLVGGRWADSRGAWPRRIGFSFSLSKKFAGEAKYACRSANRGWTEKVRIITIVFILWAVSMLEIGRLALGCPPQR